MKVNKNNFVHLMTGSFSSLPELVPSARVTSERVLSWVSPRELPGLGVLLSSSHTKEQTSQHLIAKWLHFGFLRKNERFVSQLLSAVLPDYKGEFQKFILSNEIRRSSDRRELHRQLLRWNLSFVPKDPKRYLFTFEPELILSRVWLDRKRFPPKKFVGIGYTDQGTLSTSPAWQDQVLWNREEESLVDELKIILSQFKVQLPSRGSNLDIPG